MLIRRRTWFYRLAGQLVPQQICLERPVTMAIVRRILRRTVGNPLEIWGRGSTEPSRN
jgi:hypothetical protein